MSHGARQRDLERLVIDFDTSPHTFRRLIEECWASDRGNFLQSAVSVLARPNETQGVGYLLSFLMQHESLPVRLGDPDLCTREEASLIARRASRIDPTFDRQVAQLLMGGIRLESAQTERLLAILESISPPANLLPLLNVILRHDNPKIRSKAALLMGRGKRNSEWVLQQLTEPDGRVRANAVESMWGLDSADVIDLYLTAARDPAARVVVNAAVGLYRARQTHSIELLMSLASHEACAFRRSASWGMGNTKDPRFMPLLAKLIRDPEAAVRSNALRAASVIRAHLSVLKREPLSIHIAGARVKGSGMRQLDVCLRNSTGSALPVLGQLSFAVAEEETPVQRYEVTHYPQAAQGSIGIILPLAAELPTNSADSFSAALREALQYKPKEESWATAYYTHGDAGGADFQPLLQHSPEQLERGFEAAAKAFHSGVLQAIQAVCPILSAGRRVMVVVGNATPESTSIVFHREAQLSNLFAELKRQSIAVHGIIFPGCTPLFQSMLRTLTRETGGVLHVLASTEELPAQLIHTLATAHSEYSIRYWGFEEHMGPRSVHLMVSAPSSFGETLSVIQAESS